MLKTIFSRSALFLLASLLTLAALEAGARLGVGWYGSPVDRAQALMRIDPNLGWSIKKNLHQNFFGSSVETDNDGFRIPGHPAPSWLLLGPSSAFGWGVQARETYAYLVPKIRNASQIGYSLEQGWREFQALENRNQYGGVLLAFGINDLDRYRFFWNRAASDQEFFESPVDPMKVRKEQLNASSVLFRMLFRAIDKAKLDWGCELQEPYPLRVSWQRFSRLLDTFRAETRQNHQQLIVIGTPFGRPSPQLNLRSLEEDELNLATIKSRISRGETGSALLTILEEEKRAPWQSGWYYWEAFLLRKAGRCDLARARFAQGTSLEPQRIAADVFLLNHRIRDWANKNKVAFVDSETLLGKEPALFFDAVHPSPAGHSRIAIRLQETIFRQATLR